MYYIYKEQAYLAALKAANRLSQSNTCVQGDLRYLTFNPLSIWCFYSLQVLAHWLFRRGKIVQSCRVTRSENSAKVSCVICWSNRRGWNSRFLANPLDGNVLFVLEKRNVCPLLFTQSARKNHAWKMNFTNVLDWLLKSSKTYQLIFLS